MASSNSTSELKSEEEINGWLQMSGLILPGSLKLNGSENYQQWKQIVVRNIIAAGLLKYLRKDSSQPNIDISNWQLIDQAQIDKVSEWVRANTKASNAIIYNCTTSAQAIIKNYNTAADMWTALEQAYEGSGIVVQYQELVKFITVSYEDHNDLTSFITSFKNNIQRLSQVMDSGEKTPAYWPAMLFVHALERRFPIWADRQRNRHREKDVEKRPSLEDLIADIQDEARRDEKTSNNFGKSDSTKALNLHGEQPAKKATGQCKMSGLRIWVRTSRIQI